MTFGARSRRPVLAMTAREREQQRVAALAVKIAGYLEERGPTRKTVLREALCIEDRRILGRGLIYMTPYRSSGSVD